jgi:dipeptidyl aminopeptidase/acylaminoacyl peptidase
MNKTRVPLLIALLLPAISFAQDGRPAMSIVDMLNVPTLSNPRLSPDGMSIVYELAESDWKKNKQVSHLWLQRIGDEDPVQLTYGVEGESGAAWSPDGRNVAFLTKRGEDEETQIYLLPMTGGESRPLTSHDSSVSDISWSPDGSAVYFLAPDPKSEEEKKKEKIQDDVFQFDEDAKHGHLWRKDIDAEEAVRITEGDFTIRNYRLSRDGRQIVVYRAPTPRLNSIFEAEIYLIDESGENWTQITDNDYPETGAELSPGGDTVLYLADVDERGTPYHNNNIFLAPVEGGAARMLLPEVPYEFDAVHWSPDGRSVFAIANTGVRSDLFEIDLDSEEMTQLTRGDHAIGDWDYRPEIDIHTASISSADNPGDVWILKDGTPTRATRVYVSLAQEWFLPRQEAVTWTGADGVEVEGLVYYPKGYEEGERYPLAVQTHGGPAASDKYRYPGWGSYMQVLTGRGWLVFRPNYRGSVGYGDDFLRDMVGHYFNQSHLDVMTGVDYLIEEGLADPDQMIKMGWSGGGHMTNKIITFTDRFKAAASGAGAANWVSMYAQTDIRIHRENWFGNSPWVEGAPIDKYWEHSPLSKVWKVTTPTIVLVGAEDERVPATQSIELYRALRANGVDTHLYMAPREPHGWRELRHRLFKVNVELDWFEKHALGREYEWEAAPEVEDDEEESE